MRCYRQISGQMALNKRRDEVWTPGSLGTRNLGTGKFGHQEVWALEIWAPGSLGTRNLGTGKFGHQEVWAPEIWAPGSLGTRNLGTGKFGHQDFQQKKACVLVLLVFDSGGLVSVSFGSD
ncbi:hypothetical protein niasHT_010858 [Heterodera trifolii]|uniref:Uncharacterized protein n=1 Tax=Heterodera trifolii TaxID=157864 RepID=A0ABD2LEI2_9BILA